MKLIVLCGHGEAFLPGVSRGKSVYGQDAAYRRRFPAKRSKSSTFRPADSSSEGNTRAVSSMFRVGRFVQQGVENLVGRCVVVALARP
jgi:hypothetical protein